VTQEQPQVCVYVSAGSNIEPQRNLRSALDDLERIFGDLVVSSVYRTRAVGFEGDDFLNLVLSFATDLPPQAVVAELDRVEASAGRHREGGRFAPRTLDLDLLLFGDAVIDGPDLTLPRADVTDYAFVLGPLAELAPDLVHPVLGKSMQALWSGFDKTTQPIKRLVDPL